MTRNNLEHLSIPEITTGADHLTEVISLPTGGQHYSNPKLKTGFIEIFLMVARHEDILSNESYFKTGVILEKLLKSLIVDPEISPSELLPADALAIILAARVSAFGPEFETVLKCPVCSASITKRVDIEASLVKVGGSSDRFNTCINERNLINITLPKSNKVVACRLYTPEVEDKMYTNLAVAKKINVTDLKIIALKGNVDVLISTVDYLSEIIYSVDGETDTKSVRKELENMKALDIRYLKTAYIDTNYKVLLKTKAVCDCGWADEVEVGIMTPDFFWPKF